MALKLRITLTVAAIAGSVVLAVLTSVLLSLHVARESQHQWCDTLELLTSRPVARPADPVAHHAQYENWLFYQDLKGLAARFGC